MWQVKCGSQTVLTVLVEFNCLRLFSIVPFSLNLFQNREKNQFTLPIMTYSVEILIVHLSPPGTLKPAHNWFLMIRVDTFFVSQPLSSFIIMSFMLPLRQKLNRNNTNFALMHLSDFILLAIEISLWIKSELSESQSPFSVSKNLFEHYFWKFPKMQYGSVLKLKFKTFLALRYIKMNSEN